MAIVPLVLQSITWDTDTNTATLTLIGSDVPEPPPMPEGAQWRPGVGSVISLSLPVKKKAIEAAATGIVAEPRPDGSTVFTRYTFTHGKWADPVRVFEDGTPHPG